jgi:hypothetical protein
MLGRPTRRRLLAISAGLLCIVLLSLPALAQGGSQPQLPECKASARFGDWRVLADDRGGVVVPASSYDAYRKLSDSIILASFNYRYSAPHSSYDIDFTMRNAPAGDFDVTLAAPDGYSRAARLAPTVMKMERSDRYRIRVDIGRWFLEAIPPLKQPGSTTITFVNLGTQLFAMELRSDGFAEATEFLRKEQVRLQQMEKNKQCYSFYTDMRRQLERL